MGDSPIEEFVVAAVQTAFEELCQTPVESVRFEHSGSARIVASIDLKREPPGVLRLAFPEEVLSSLASRYLPSEPLTADLLRDLAGEFANVVAGQLKTMLKNTPEHFLLSTPLVESGDGVEPTDRAVGFLCDAGPFWLELRLPPVEIP